MKLATQDVPVRVQSIERIIDTSSLSESAGDVIERNQVAEVILRTRHKVAVDPYSQIAATGRFVIGSGHQIVGGGTASMTGFPDQRPSLERHRAS